MSEEEECIPVSEVKKIMLRHLEQLKKLDKQLEEINKMIEHYTRKLYVGA